MISPVFFGCCGTQLSDGERAFFSKSQPAGLILFSRNIESREQLKHLVDDFIGCIKHDYPMVLVDQEGGRVQRLGAPHWHQWPSAADIGELYKTDKQAAIALAQASAKTIAHSLIECGIKVNAAPVLDLRFDYADSVIGDRSFGSDINSIVELAGCFVDCFLESGIIPVIKHLPGHGRALTDSHFTLPRIDLDSSQLLNSDCVPFARLSRSHAAITAHILYSALDENAPLTLSAAGVSWLRNTLGYGGLLISDCLHMKALQGSIASLSRQAQQAGIDLVTASHTDLTEKEQVFLALSPANDTTIERIHTAWQAAGETVSLATSAHWHLIDNWNIARLTTDPTEVIADKDSIRK